MRTKSHHHPCQACGTKTECGGVYEQNYDGWPEVICPEFHLANGTINTDFICEACERQADAASIGPCEECACAEYCRACGFDRASCRCQPKLRGAREEP